MQLTNQVAIVTGAASGIGNEIARTFAAHGAKTVIADLDAGRAETAAAEIRQLGHEALAAAIDVSNEAQVESGVARVLETYGGVNILVNNAGFQHIDALVDVEFAVWKKMLAVHLDGAFLMTRACMRAMIAAGHGGKILFMGSVHSFEASPRKGPYVTAKHGLAGLCRTVAKEGAAHGIRSNLICPGFVRTPLVEKQIPELAASMGMSEEDVIKKIMLATTVDGEFSTTQDIAETALFLAAFPTNALTGQAIVVSHGWHMR